MLHVLQEPSLASMNTVVAKKRSSVVSNNYSSSILVKQESENTEETKAGAPEAAPVLPFPILTRRWTFSGMADEHGILSALKAQEFR